MWMGDNRAVILIIQTFLTQLVQAEIVRILWGKTTVSFQNYVGSSPLHGGGEVEALIWDRYRNKSTTIHQKGLKVGRSALLTKFFLQIFNRKEHTHILTKIFAKNPVISAISLFDN